MTTEGCPTCGSAEERLRSELPGDLFTVVDGPSRLLEALNVRSLPTALVVDRRSRIVMRRSGESVVADAHRIAGAGRAVTL